MYCRGGYGCCHKDHSNMCGEGEGDCNQDEDCAGSLICGNNNCHIWRSLTGRGLKMIYTFKVSFISFRHDIFLP